MLGGVNEIEVHRELQQAKQHGPTDHWAVDLQRLAHGDRKDDHADRCDDEAIGD